MNKRRRFKAKRIRRFNKLDKISYSIYMNEPYNEMAYYNYLDKIKDHCVHFKKFPPALY